MKTFQHHNARSLKQAASLLSIYDGKAMIHAGGTDILGSLRDQCVAEYPEALINIKTIPGLDCIKAGRKGLRIGALARLSDIVKSPAVRGEYPLLAEAAGSVANPNLRNMATLGGNLAQDVRCWYYRYPRHIGGPITCLRKGGKTCSALQGDNRYHSIFGAAAASERRCAGHCPAHVDIPDYLRLVRENKMAEAAQRLLGKNPFPAITGRVCPVFCEPNCNRGEYDEPVAIHSVERGAGDYILDHPEAYFAPPETLSGKRITIVGSGPAGLAAAYYLRQSGHNVNVIEKMPEPGGMLLYSIPPFRLPKEIVRKQIQALAGMGVRFETGVTVDAGLASRVQAESDAVFVACGTWRSVQLGVPGEDSRGVHRALDYLKRVNGDEVVRLGKSVVVIGGGSVAMDAARTARRTGSDEVHVVCLETRDLSSKDRMPALDWEILDAEEEGIIIHPSLGIKEILTSGDRVAGVHTKKCISVKDARGNFNPRYDEAMPSLSLRADSVIVAVGQNAELSPFPPGDKIFLGGDLVEGPSTVVQAIASARNAVDKIETFLGFAQKAADVPEGVQEYPATYFDDIPRLMARKAPAEDRLRTINVEDVAGVSEADIRKEACRCVSCGCLAVGPSDLAVALVALSAVIVTTRRSVPAQEFFSATASSSTVLQRDELIKEVLVPRPPRQARQRYLKFTIREPIDFAVVSVASIISEKGGDCSDARLVLGAVGPAPVRARAAETAIKGKPITAESAGAAADLALAAVQPLSGNGYKIDIVRTLIRRSILGTAE